MSGVGLCKRLGRIVNLLKIESVVKTINSDVLLWGEVKCNVVIKLMCV